MVIGGAGGFTAAMTGHQELLTALQASSAHLRDLVDDLGAGQLTASAYPTEWTVADVLSHLGSGATILHRRLDDVLTGLDTPEDFNQSVWDTWNAMEPVEQASGVVAADQALVERLDSLDPDEAARFRFSIGPMELDLAGFIGLRLSEHTVHTWDVEVALDPAATLLPQAVAPVLDRLGAIIGFTTKPAGAVRDISLRTTSPDRSLILSLTGDSASLQPGSDGAPADVELPAEAFIRLVYGRLDADHTPPAGGTVDLDDLRPFFPGF